VLSGYSLGVILIKRCLPVCQLLPSLLLFRLPVCRLLPALLLFRLSIPLKLVGNVLLAPQPNLIRWVCANRAIKIYGTKCHRSVVLVTKH